MNESADQARVWTVLELIQASAEYLARHGVDSPRLDAELLLAHVLGVDRLQLYLQAQRPIVAAERRRYRELVKSRGERVPLQHLTGTAQVLDLVFLVRDGVFIPRPETEVLIEVCRELFPAPPDLFVEVGTGSGCIAISLLAKWPRTRAVGFDLDQAAVALTADNAARHGVADRLEVRREDATQCLLPRCDLLLSNPPYVATAEITALEPEVRAHDPRAALDGGSDGLAVVRALVPLAHQALRPGGWLVLEHGHQQGPACRDLMEEHGFDTVGSREDLAGHVRVSVGRRP